MQDVLIEDEEDSFSDASLASFEIYSVCDTCDRRNNHRVFADNVGTGRSEFDTTVRHSAGHQLAAGHLNMGQLNPSRLGTIDHEPMPIWLPLDAGDKDRKRNCCQRTMSSRGAVTLIGVIGVAIGTAGLLSYGIMQIPPFREHLGESHKVPLGQGNTRINMILSPGYYPENLFSREHPSRSKIFTPGELMYGVEIALVVIGTVVSIITNGLLSMCIIR